METIERIAASVELAYDSWGAQSGLSGDQLKYLTTFVLAIPLGFLFNALPLNKRLRQTYGLLVGLFFCFFVLGRWAWLHSFFTAAVAYGLMRAKAPPLAVMAWMMLYMTASHIYRLYTDYLGWHLDFTGPQMLLTQSLSSLAYQLADYRKKDQLEDEYLKDKAVDRLPDLFEFYSFVYFFCSFLAGPVQQLRDYQRLCDGTLFEGKQKQRVSMAVMPTLRSVMYALLCAPAFYLTGKYSLEWTLSDAFAKLSFPVRIAYMNMAFLFFRTRYYFAWYFAEAGSCACGAAYTSDGKWMRSRNAYPLDIELAENIRSVTSNWNISTARWLRYYVYMRLPSGHVATYGTYFVSAFWHGFYPGYYMFFLYAALLTETARLARKHLRPFVVVVENGKERPKSFKFIYDWIGVFCTLTVTNFGGLGFVLLSFSRTWEAMKSVDFFGFIIVPIVFVYLSVVHPKIFRAPRPPSGAGGSAEHAKKKE